MHGAFRASLRKAKKEQVAAHCDASPEYVRSLDEFGYSPLMGASRVGRIDLVTVLLEHGADPRFTAHDGASVWDCAVEYAVEAGMEESMEACGLLKVLRKVGGGPSFATWPVNTLGGLSTHDVEALCIADEDFVSSRVDSKCTPLMLACSAGRADLVRLLLSKGADVNPDCGSARDHPILKSALLGWRSRDFNKNVFDLVFAAGADPNAGFTPILHHAIAKKRMDLVMYLLSRGCDPNLKDGDGATPLLWCTGFKKQKPADPDSLLMMAVLVGGGARVQDRNGFGETLKTYLTESDYAELQALVRQRPRIPCESIALDLYEETLRGVATQDIESLCARDPGYVAKVDSCGFTPLMAACSVFRLDIVRVLIHSGADVNYRATNGETALTCALNVTFGADRVIDLLLRAGADLNVSPQPLLHRALEAQKPPGLLRFLLSKGLDPNQKDQGGCPAIFVPTYRAHEPVSEFVLNCIAELINAGADAGVTDPAGKTLREAIGAEHYERLRDLVYRNGALP